jgi:hypothetical protein
METPSHLLIAGEWVATERALPVLNPYSWDPKGRSPYFRPTRPESATPAL